MMYEQNDLTRANQEWSYKNFDSPAAQRAAMVSAGVNPFVEGSALQSGVSNAQSAPSAPSGSPQSGSMPSNSKYQAQMMAAQSLGQALQLQADLKVKHAQADNLLADAEEKRGRTLDPEVTKAIQRMQLSAAQSNAVIKGVEAQFAIVNAATDLQGKQQAIAESKQRIQKMLSDMGVNDAQIQDLWASMDLKMSQALYMDEQTTDLRETRAARINKMNSETGLNEAKRLHEDVMRMTDEDLRGLRKEELQEKIQQIRGWITKNATEHEIRLIDQHIAELDKRIRDQTDLGSFLKKFFDDFWTVIPVKYLGALVGKR